MPTSDVELYEVFGERFPGDTSAFEEVAHHDLDSARAVDVGSVFDANHANDMLVVVESVDNSVRASARGSIAGEFSLQRFADPFWFFTQRTDQELDHRGCDNLG